MRDAAIEAGAPENCIQWIEHPSIQATGALMQHPGVATILATGGPGMVKAAYSSGKPALGVAPVTLRPMSILTWTSCAPPTIWCSPSTSITA